MPDDKVVWDDPNVQWDSPAPERSLGGFAGNVLSSGANLVGDLVNAVTSPKQTAKAVGQLGMGAVESVIPGTQGHEQNVQALIDLYKQRYGSMDNLVKTLYEDPVGVLADLSTVAGGAGLAGKGVQLAAKTAKLGKVANVAGKTAKAATTVANVTDPIAAPVRLGAKAIGAGKIPERMYESALKPSLSEKNRPRIPGQIATGLSEGIVVSEGGAKKLHGLVDTLNTKIEAEIAASRKTVSPKRVAQRAEDIKKDWRNQVNPNADLKEINSAKKEFIKNNQMQIGVAPDGSPIMAERPMPVAEAQKVKQGTYVQLRKKYGELGSARVEAEKALARGLKEEIASAIPEISALNARESKLLGLDTELERAVSRIRNHQIFGIGTPIAAGGVAAMTGSAKAALAAGILRSLIDSPGIKSRIAIGIHRARKLNPGKFGVGSTLTPMTRVQQFIDYLGQEPEQPQ